VSPEIAENLDVIAHEIQRLDRVVQGFLRFVRPQDLRLAPVDVNTVLSDVARLARPEAARAGVEIVLDLARGLPPVTADAELLAQASGNLVSNGVQAMSGGGTLVVASRRLAPGGVEIRVSDQGMGIPPENLEKIFRLYFTTKPGGSGIGLAMVYRIVQMHDGRIDVESTVGKGTTVKLTLPATPGKP
jgi:signal transduction histidine kinase